MIFHKCPSLDHLDRMTDSTGLIQHAIYSIPRRESGYTTDDNARALRLCARLWDDRPDERMLGRVACYLSFLEHARCPVRGFHNFLSYQRDWLDAAGTGDCQGQAVLALSEVLGSSLPVGYRELARELLDDTRRELAHQYASDGTLSASDIAYLLGFSEPSSLSRAMSRWKREGGAPPRTRRPRPRKQD